MTTEDERMQVAVFRHSVISGFINSIDMSRAQIRQLMRDKCDRKWQIPFSQKTRISKQTINHWIRLYKRSGMEGLLPKGRSDQGHSRAIDDDTCRALACLRKEIPAATVPHLIKQMNQRKLVTAGTVLNNTTVYRLLHQQDLMHLTGSRLADRRQHEAELPNDLWQSAVMQGPIIGVDGRQKETYLITILDDYSRLIVYARFYSSETPASYLDALENAFARRGLPRKLYVGNGPAFRCRHLEYVTASLSINLIDSKAYLAERKIEMWFEAVQSWFLPHITDTTLPELNGALDRYLNDDYHQRKHIDIGQQTPLERFTSQMRCLRSAPENLKDYFRSIALRTVTKDRTITLYGRIYKAPMALIGKRVELLYHEAEPENVEVKYRNKSYGMIRPVNLTVNYRGERDIDEYNQIALFRYGIISDFVNRKEVLRHGEKEQLLRSKYNCNWKIPFSDRTRISRGIILYWIKRYEESGGKIVSLYPRSRSDIGKSRVIDTQTAKNLVNLTKNSNIDTVKTIISEMKRRALVTPGTLLTYSSVYYLIRTNGLMDYLNVRKKPTQMESYNSDKDRIWLRKLQQGKIKYEELHQDLTLRIATKDINILNNCILKKPLKYRNRALTILSYHKGIPIDLISEYYLVPKPTILNHLRRYKKEGLGRLMKHKRGGIKKHEDPRYINAFFTILHTPPCQGRLYNVADPPAWKCSFFNFFFF